MLYRFCIRTTFILSRWTRCFWHVWRKMVVASHRPSGIRHLSRSIPVPDRVPYSGIGVTVCPDLPAYRVLILFMSLGRRKGRAVWCCVAWWCLSAFFSLCMIYDLEYAAVYSNERLCVLLNLVWWSEKHLPGQQALFFCIYTLTYIGITLQYIGL